VTSHTSKIIKLYDNFSNLNLIVFDKILNYNEVSLNLKHNSISFKICFNFFFISKIFMNLYKNNCQKVIKGSPHFLLQDFSFISIDIKEGIELQDLFHFNRHQGRG
jgi:hypothetical protein